MTLAEAFLALHVPGSPLLLPNPWDRGSARVLVGCGFRALATTSSGFAATLGRGDGSVTRDEAVEHAGQIAAAVDVPVSADLENGFGDDPEDVADCVRAAVAAGLAGCSIEDYTRRADDPIYALEHATDRVRAAVEAADGRLVITARAENYLHGRADPADTIARLQAFQEAGAPVLYAPGITDAGQIGSLVADVDRPVNVLALPSAPPVAELARLGVARISVGGAFMFAALGALVSAGREFLDEGTYGFWKQVGVGREVIEKAFGPT